MPAKLRRCRSCGEYTIRADRCPHCGSTDLHVPHPPKFSPEDRYLMVKYKSILYRRRETGFIVQDP